MINWILNAYLSGTKDQIFFQGFGKRFKNTKIMVCATRSILDTV